jgi:hypothetical protein
MLLWDTHSDASQDVAAENSSVAPDCPVLALALASKFLKPVPLIFMTVIDVVG